MFPTAHIFDHLVSEWTFEPISPTSCRVNVLVDFRVANPLYGSVVNTVFADTASRQLEAFTKRAKERHAQWQRQRAQAEQARAKETPQLAVQPQIQATPVPAPAVPTVEPVIVRP